MNGDLIDKKDTLLQPGSSKWKCSSLFNGGGSSNGLTALKCDSPLPILSDINVAIFLCWLQCAGTIFQQGGQDQPFPAGGLGSCKPPAGSGAEPRRQADFENNLLKIN